LLIGAYIKGIITHRLLVLTALIPSGTPILLIPLLVTLEVLAWIIRLISLGLRLAINITTGHVLVTTCTGLLLLG
jgi:F-type H+-transporting ATPase subunit a